MALGHCFTGGALVVPGNPTHSLGGDAAGLRAVMEKYLAAYTNAPKTGLGKIIDIRELGRTPSGRVAALSVQTESGSYTLRGNDIRFVLRTPGPVS